MADDLINELASWLGKQGYPLEMRVERICREAGFETTQGYYYQDPDTQVPRETDILASTLHERERWMLSTTLVIECKLARDKPYILFSHASPPNPSHSWLYEPSSPLARRIIRRVLRIDKRDQLAPFRLPSRTGYGLIQSFKDNNKDTAFEALISVTKASDHLLKEVTASEIGLGPIAEIVIPVVAIDGRLFDCQLGNDNELEIEEIVAGTMLWRRPQGGRTGTIVRIITLQGLSSFVNAVSEAGHHIASVHEAVIDKIVDQTVKDAPPSPEKAG